MIEAMSRSRSIGLTPCWLRCATPIGPHPLPRPTTILVTKCLNESFACSSG